MCADFSTGLPVSDFAVEGYDEVIADVDESAGFVPAADVCGDVPSRRGTEQCTIEIYVSHERSVNL